MSVLSEVSVPSGGCCEVCGSAWDKLQVAKKRLHLQTERLSLEQEMLKAEKKNLKRNTKLLQRQEKELQLKLNEIRSDIGVSGSAMIAPAGNVSVELKEMKEQLAETQSSLAQLLVERHAIQRERDVLKEKLSQDQLEKVSISEHDEHQITELEGRLKLFEKENQQLRQENQDYQESVESAQKAANLEASITTDDLQKENERLRKQVMERERQIEDWKLLIPRNKLLLEQAHQKNERMAKQLKELEENSIEQEEFIKEIQLTKEALVKQRDRRQSEFDQLKQEKDTIKSSYKETREVLESIDLDDIHSEENNEKKEKLIQLRNVQPNDIIAEEDGVEKSQYSLLLPFDLPPGENHGKKHVIEWDWSGNNLSGMYTGWVDLEGNPNGHGTIRVDNGSLYVGEWQHGKRHGHGVFLTVEGDLFYGYFRNDISHGRGMYIWADGQVYTGDYVDGVREGKGIETWPRGARYEGEYHRDQRNGLGEYLYPDGRRYTGEYKDDRLHGQGVQTSSDGTVLYEGQWTMGEFING